VVTMAPQLEGWEGLNLRSALEDLFTCPVSVEGEVSLSLLAEGWQGVAKGLHDALFVHLGVGVGAAVLVGGKIHRGADGAAGEIGLMPYPIRHAGGETDLVPLESLAGGGALQRKGRELARRTNASRLLELAGGDVDRVDASTVFEACRQGDPDSRWLIDEATEALAWGISAVICALNPPAVIVGGGLSRGADLFLPQLERRASSMVPFPPAWLVSQLGDEAVALGAVKQATAMVERDLFESLGRKAS
jgi:predicted NBD/HSP70 family sugar kinase